MSDDFLASALLSDRQIVTYRSLSRAAGCHVSEAKKLLQTFYDTHKSSLHAVYLVSGSRPSVLSASQSSLDADDGADADRMSDSGAGISGEQIPVSVLEIVPQERLDRVTASLSSVASVEIYSLGPGLSAGSRPNLEVISDVNRQIRERDIRISDLNTLKTFGVLVNPWVKRRDLGAPPVAPKASSAATSAAATSAASTASVFGKPAPKSAGSVSVSPATTKSPAASRNDIKSMFGKQKPTPAAAAAAAAGTSSEAPSSKPTASKKAASGSIIAAFGHAQAQAQARKEREKMAIPSDEEDDGEAEADLSAFTVKRKQPKKLKLAVPSSPIDTDDGVISDYHKDDLDQDFNRDLDRDVSQDAGHEHHGNHPDHQDEDVDMDVDMVNEPKPAQPEEPPSQPDVVVSNGRRRGRRRVTKKIRAKDQDGFLVSREVHEWESFSESDGEPPKAKPVGSVGAGTAVKAATAGKKGQGSILSFFQKK